MDRRYWFWINNIEGIGNTKIRNLLASFDTPYDVFLQNDESLKKVPFIGEKDVANILSDENRKQIFAKYDKELMNGKKFVFPDEEGYPKRLNELYDKPFILYYKGILPNDDIKKIAIVGSRNASFYGKNIAKELGRLIARAGGCVVSGLANGIDSEAHLGAVQGGGYTCAILAGGVDKCYPLNNYNLYMDIINTGCVISEFPGDSDTRPGMFPLRNRIISGMSDAVIVVEAGKRSGSLITAAMALEQNRNIYAIPGRIGDKTALGCNELIADGAMIVTDFNRLLSDLGLVTRENENSNEKYLDLATDEKMLYSLLLDFTPKSLETLISESKLDSNVVIRTLMSLEIKGVISEISKNFYVRIQ